jgi:hypothetical protein
VMEFFVNIMGVVGVDVVCSTDRPGVKPYCMRDDC